MTSAQEREMGDELMTPQQVQQLLGVSYRTYQRYLHDRLLVEASRTLKGHRRFRRGDVDALLAASSRRTA